MLSKRRRGMMAVVVRLAAAMISAAVLMQVNVATTTHRPVVIGMNGMVASNNPLASEVGMSILKQGGNAFDAAVATAAAVGVAEPVYSGPGGEGFLLIYVAEEKQVKALNSIGKAPYAAKTDMFTRDNMGMGPLSSIVPGTFDSWIELLKEYGTMSLGQVLQPSIEYLERGVPQYPFNRRIMLQGEESMRLSPDKTRIYLAKGRVPEVGEIYSNTDLAKTYRTIVAAEEKARSLGRRKAIEAARDVFYKGEIAEAIVKYYEKVGGLITAKDLADYKAEWMEPISTMYRGYNVYTMPPNSSAIAYLEQMNIMEGFDVRALGHNSTQYVHLFAESIKLSRADRWDYVADPAFVSIPTEDLLSKEHTSKQRARINPDRASDFEHISAVKSLGQEDTTHLTVADSHGNLVSLTQSGGGLGRAEIPEGLGFWISSGMSWFDLETDTINRIEGGKRARWNMSPTIVMKDGEPFLAIGTPGGQGIWQTVPQALMNIIDFDMNIQEAIEAPRFVDTPGGSELRMEGRIPVEVRELLSGRGHEIEVLDDYTSIVGGMNGIMIHPESNALMGGADPRRDGYAIGW